MTEYEHAIWCTIADASKRAEWYAPKDAAEARSLRGLFLRGYYDCRRVRRDDRRGAGVREYRLAGLWPV